MLKGPHRAKVISDRKAGIALNDLLAPQRPLARFPERCRVRASSTAGSDDYFRRSVTTGQGAVATTRSAMFPRRRLGNPRRPCVPTTMISLTVSSFGCQIYVSFLITPRWREQSNGRSPRHPKTSSIHTDTTTATDWREVARCNP
jgi:hypothetical protein